MRGAYALRSRRLRLLSSNPVVKVCRRRPVQTRSQAKTTNTTRVSNKPRTSPGWLLDCTHAKSCSGCDVQSNLHDPPKAQAAKEFFGQIGVLDFQTLGVAPHAWRCRAKLAVRGTAGKPVIGLFRKGSHMAMPIPHCRVHHPRINAAIDVLQRTMMAMRTAPYCEADGTGSLRYVQLTLSAGVPHGKAHKDRASTVQACSKLAAALWLYGGPGLSTPQLFHSIWINLQPSKNNSIFSQHWQLLHGPEFAWNCFGTCSTALGPGGFVQANYGAMDLALEHIKQATPLGSAVSELHAGVGVIGLNIAQDRSPTIVKFVEINPACEAAFKASRAAMNQVPAPLEYHVAAAGAAPASWLHGADVVVVDPPRKGLEPSLLRALTTPGTQGLNTLVYLSCDFAALKHDCRVLLSGGWHVSQAKAFLFFPGTDSVETLVIFKKS